MILYCRSARVVMKAHGSRTAQPETLTNEVRRSHIIRNIFIFIILIVFQTISAMFIKIETQYENKL